MAICFACRDGRVMDRNDKLVLCEVCYGTGQIFPGEICRCGRSLNFTVGSVQYCGRAECLKKSA
jgi:hypothetical protein